MSTVKLERDQEQLVAELDPKGTSSQLRESISPMLPKANTYLLDEFKTRIEKFQEAKQHAEEQRKYFKLSPEERKKVDQEKKEQVEQSKKDALTPEEVKQQAAPPYKRSTWETLFWGAEPEEVVGYVTDAAKKVATVTGVSEFKFPITLEKVDACKNRALRDAETDLWVEKYKMRQFMDQLSDNLNPFTIGGMQVGPSDPTKARGRFYDTSVPEAMQTLATVLVQAVHLAKETDDPELTAVAKALAEFIKQSSRMRKEDFQELGYLTPDSLEGYSDLALAKKWGLKVGDGTKVPGMGVVHGNLPEMFFEVQRMLTSYDAAKFLSTIEEELLGSLKEVEMDSTITDKAKERRRVWNEVISKRITGSKRQGDEFDGIQTIVQEYMYGAAILAPIVLGTDGALTPTQGSIFRLLAEQSKRENGPEDELSYRIIDTYSTAVKAEKIRDLSVEKFGKDASAMSDQELKDALSKFRTESAKDYVKAEGCYGEVYRNLPAFVELSKSLRSFSKTMPAPNAIDSAATDPAAFSLLVADIRRARKEVEQVIEQHLKLSPEQAIKLAEEFVAKNQGRLSTEAQQIPERVRMTAEKVFGYKK